MQPIIQRLTWADGSVLSIETGRLARQADGSVVLKHNDTMLIATVVARREIDPSKDFLPLSVDYKENFSSAGRFPGGYFKRDGRLNEYEILTSRIVDRTLRPMFPEDYHADIQVIITLISADPETSADALACVAASSALMCSDIPFPDPVATVRVAQIDGKMVVNPAASIIEKATLDLIVGGTADSIVMVEGEMQEVSEADMLEALKTAHAVIKQLCNLQLELRKAVGKTTREYDKPLTDDAMKQKLHGMTYEKLRQVIYKPAAKHERSDAFSEIAKEAIEKLTAEDATLAEDEIRLKLAKNYIEGFKYEIMRQMILKDDVRLDGRKPHEIRPIWCETGYLPRAHGSALFTRGETQSLSSVTLGTKLDEQTIDYATRQGSKRFMLQYNFPPFSTGEVKPLRAPSRRETGHGNLAERALKKLMPTDGDYTVRIVSDILESNGSSSMATVCAGSLALMDAGIKIREHVSGIAMGLIVEGDKYAILSDILGDEDHLGDMDFKTTGTARGLTACQMDIKVRGLSFEILAKALAQAKDGRMHILGKLNETIQSPREDLSQYAPRLVKMIIPADTIGAVIGSGGKVIQEIQRVTGTEISIEEINNTGEVVIASPNKDNLEKAKKWIEGIVTIPEVGTEYIGKVKALKESGAIVEFLPGKEGYLHISEIAYKRIEKMEGTLEIGEEFPVKLIEVDAKAGRFRLSRKAMLPKPEGWVERERPSGDRGGRGGDRGGRGGYNRGGRGDRGDRGDRGGRGGHDREHRPQGGHHGDHGRHHTSNGDGAEVRQSETDTEL